MKIYMKKKYKLVILIIVIIIGLIESTFVQTKNPNISELVEKIRSSTDLTIMEKGDKSKLRKLYSISDKDIEDYMLYAPKTNMDANEIIILKAKNQQDIDNLKEKIEKRISKQEESFKNYRPEQYEILDKHILSIKGKYIIAIVSKDVDKIKKVVDDSFK